MQSLTASNWHLFGSMGRSSPAKTRSKEYLKLANQYQDRLAHLINRDAGSPDRANNNSSTVSPAKVRKHVLNQLNQLRKVSQSSAHKYSTNFNNSPKAANNKLRKSHQ